MKDKNYLKEIKNLSKMFGDEFAENVYNNFMEEKNVNKKNSKIPYTVKELLNLKVGDPVWVKYYDESNCLRENSLNYVCRIYSDNIIHTSDKINSMFVSEFNLNSLNENLKYENVIDNSGWTCSIYKVK